ncbi:CD44 antigen isoform X1 [Sorex araneus]|uniref:CD44 antigen isoform X1 n=1 Tax=Sorex araneus TaxID=42254 RepID=UPI0024336A5B|nr:CD44 antigen isoform X1 [Sorex araneus]
MDQFWWRAAWGLCLVHLSLAQIELNVTCRYSGVFHVEKNGRYSISRTEAADLCTAFNSTLPTMAQMKQALQVGFETCRYGFIQEHVVIPRIHPNSICAANNTGVYILTSNTSQYDTYCYNASAPVGEDCASVTNLPNAFDGQVSITIVNRDGTRYVQKGEYRTNPNDINPSNAPDEDISSGSSSERSTSGGYIFHTHLPTMHPTQDQDRSWVSNDPENTPATTLMGTSDSTSKTTTKRQGAQDWFSWWFQPTEDRNLLQTTTKMAGANSNITLAGWNPTEENEDERDKHPSYSGSGIDDDEDFVSSTISTTTRLFNYPNQNPDWTQWNPDHSNSDALPQTTTRMNDVNRSGTSATGENWTQETHPPLIHHEHHDEEDTQHSTSTTQETPSSATEETTTHTDQFVIGWPGEYPHMPKEDSHSTPGTTATSAHDNHPDQRMTTQNPEDSSWTDFFDPISHPMGQGHQTENSMDMDSSHSTTPQPSADPNVDLVEDLNRKETLSITTQQNPAQSFSTSHSVLEEDEDYQMTSAPTFSSKNSSNDGKDRPEGENHPQDSTTSLEGYTSHSSDTKEHRTLIPMSPAETVAPEVTEVTIVGDTNSNVDGSVSGDHDDSSFDYDSSGKSHTTDGSKSAGHASGSQEGGVNPTSSPKRKSQIPEWLIILASLLALALILAVCIAVNSRRRCGQKKKLVINNGNGAVEDRKPSGLNGEASKSQEMVHLVNKEPSETPDQFMTADETRNLQNVDMKIGV